MASDAAFAVNPSKLFSLSATLNFLDSLRREVFSWLPEKLTRIPRRIGEFFRLLIAKVNVEGFIQTSRESLLEEFDVTSKRAITRYLNLLQFLGLIWKQDSNKGIKIYVLYSPKMGISEETARAAMIPLPQAKRAAAPRPQETPIPQLTPQIDAKNPEMAALEAEILHPTVETQSSDKPKSNVVYVEKASKFGPEICLEYATYLQARRHGTDREIKDASNYARWMIDEGLKDVEIERWLIKQGRIKPEIQPANSQRTRSTANPANNSQPTSNQPRPVRKERARPDNTGARGTVEDEMIPQEHFKIEQETDRRWFLIDEKLRRQMVADVQRSLLHGTLAEIYADKPVDELQKIAADIAWASVREQVMREWGIPLAQKAREVAR